MHLHIPKLPKGHCCMHVASVPIRKKRIPIKKNNGEQPCRCRRLSNRPEDGSVLYSMQGQIRKSKITKKKKKGGGGGGYCKTVGVNFILKKSNLATNSGSYPNPTPGMTWRASQMRLTSRAWLQTCKDTITGIILNAKTQLQSIHFSLLHSHIPCVPLNLRNLQIHIIMSKYPLIIGRQSHHPGNAIRTFQLGLHC